MKFLKKYTTGPFDSRRTYPAEEIGFWVALWSRILNLLSRYLPLLPAMRIYLQRLRGVKIGENVFIGADVYFDESYPKLIEIENNVAILAGSMLLAHSTIPKHHQNILKEKNKGLLIKKGAYLGAKSVILPGIVIGKNSIVAAGSVVTKDVLDNSIVVGVPAEIKKTFSDDILLPYA